MSHFPATAAVLCAAMTLAACAAPSQPYLDNARALCTSGDQASCGQIPQFQAQVDAEHNQQAAAVAIGIAGGLAAVAVGAGAAYGAARPVYQPVIVCRWNCW